MNNQRPPSLPRSFGAVPRTGVIYVMEKAAAAGFTAGDPDWINLGQGAPETGVLPDSPQRLESIPIAVNAREYAPVAGLTRLRQAVADLYNQRFRAGKKSLYGPENVAISAGGRAGLTRIAAALDRIHLGHFLPDYTAYEELLELFRDFIPIPILSPGGKLPAAEHLRKEIVGRGLGGLLLSNPCNPTGDLVEGDELDQWAAQSRELSCAMIFDEFYSHYIYDVDLPPGSARALSAARYVEDVNADPVLIVDGLTKNWRYPGLRLSWTLGPESVIEAIASAGSFLDGGAPHPIQEAAIPLVAPDVAEKEALSIQSEFGNKRRFMIDSMRELGFVFDFEPRGGFYCFASLEKLRPELRNCMDFFHAALKKQVITVPGRFFDVNPGQRRSHLPSRMQEYVRLSFGPSRKELEIGLERLASIVHN